MVSVSSPSAVWSGTTRPTRAPRCVLCRYVSVGSVSNPLAARSVSSTSNSLCGTTRGDELAHDRVESTRGLVPAQEICVCRRADIRNIVTWSSARTVVSDDDRPTRCGRRSGRHTGPVDDASRGVALMSQLEPFALVAVFDEGATCGCSVEMQMSDPRQEPCGGGDGYMAAVSRPTRHEVYTSTFRRRGVTGGPTRPCVSSRSMGDDLEVVCCETGQPRRRVESIPHSCCAYASPSSALRWSASQGRAAGVGTDTPIARRHGRCGTVDSIAGTEPRNGRRRCCLARPSVAAPATRADDASRT